MEGRQLKRKRSSNAGYYCAVPQCGNRSTDKTLSFHRFPVEPIRLKKWIIAIKRDIGVNFQVTTHTRVCSSHFRKEDYLPTSGSDPSDTSTQRRQLVPCAVPSIFACSRAKTSRRCVVRRVEAPDSSKETASELPVDEKKGEHSATATDAPVVEAVRSNTVCTPLPYGNHSYCVHTEDGQLLKELLEENAALRQEVAALKAQSLSLSAVKDRAALFKHMTGLPNYATFKVLLRYLESKARRLKWWRGMVTLREVCSPGGKHRHVYKGERKLNLDEQFFAVLVRLRTGASTLEMSVRTGLSQSSFSKLFITWINFLAYELQALHKIPAGYPRVLVRAFKNFRRTRIIIDCTEVFTKRPSGLQMRKQLFSNYKHHTTAKFLVGICPSGAQCFVSNAWGGRASDQKITRECGFLDQLHPGQQVMADRGFIESMGQERGNDLLIPSFLGTDRSQLTASEVTRTRRIAEARIHVECGIKRIKDFEILQGEVDISSLHILEQMFQVCAYLTNFQHPICADIIYVS